MGRRLSLVVLISLGAGSSYTADFRASDWPMRRNLSVAGSPGIYEIPLDLDIQSKSRPDLLDLRIAGPGRLEPYRIVRNPEKELVAEVPQPPGSINAESRSTVFTLDLGRPLPFEQVEFGIADRLYNRVVRLESSSDQKHWFFIGTGYICRTLTENNDSFTVPTQQARHVRLSLVNSDSVPIHCNAIRFLIPRRTLRFIAHGPGPFRLYYGASGVRPAIDDTSEIQAFENRDPIRKAQVGPAEKNPAFVANPLLAGDIAYELRMRRVQRAVIWAGVGSVILFALLYLGYLSMEMRPRRHHSRRASGDGVSKRRRS
ncbi:MAG: DUF3999 family protein [Bryobacterales bacterium]|nr:DUF3999 family protein [Bryobacterales bacterium]